MRTKLPLSLVLTASIGVLLPTGFGAEKLDYAIAWAAAGGGLQVSSSKTFSVARAVGSRDSDNSHSASYTLSGSACAGVVVVAQSGTDELYAGIDLRDPVQALADYDHDGFSNLMKFALGADPWSPANSSAFPVLSAQSVAGNSFLTMQFKRRANAAALGLQYVPEVSQDGQTWYSDPAHVVQLQVMPMDSEFDWVTVEDLLPTTPTTPRLFRL
ncbi:MAG TPA: hypothetical protein VHI52_21750, partial [Verrucomicrobiae bacterium]|nr:hypothetical protein [Verrucomicrobiae bacterium]